MIAESPSRMDTLIEENYALVQFKDLPEPYQRSMVFYMAVDGEAWTEPFEDVDGPRFDAGKDGADWHAYWNARVAERMPQFISIYGDEYFGIAEIPTERLLTHMVHSLELQGDKRQTAAEFRADMNSVMDAPFHDHAKVDRWPVILSDIFEETMQDGFHRLGNYVRHEAPTIPAIFYPSDRHFVAKQVSHPQSADVPKMR